LDNTERIGAPGDNEAGIAQLAFAQEDPARGCVHVVVISSGERGLPARSFRQLAGNNLFFVVLNDARYPAAAGCRGQQAGSVRYPD